MSRIICILRDFFNVTSSLYRKLRIELDVIFWDARTSIWICVLRDFLDAASIPYRKIRIGLDVGPLWGSKWSLFSPHGTFLSIIGPGWDPRGPGAETPHPQSDHFELLSGVKHVSKINVCFWPEKVSAIGDQRLPTWSLRTSKPSQIHRRGCQFQVFTLFDNKMILSQYLTSEGSFWEAFWAHFSTGNQSKNGSSKRWWKGGGDQIRHRPGGGPGRGRGWVYIGKREWGLKTPRPICDGLADY